MKDPARTASQAEFDQVKTLLQGKGVKAAEVAVALGTDAGGRSLRELEQALTRWLRTRPKG